MNLKYNVIGLITPLLFACCITLSSCASEALVKSVDKTSELKIEPKVYTISSASELNVLKLAPGDKVIMKAGIWKDQLINFKAIGTKENPIILIAETGGNVFLSGNSNLKIDGEWLVVDGLSFKDGFSIKDDVIVFTKNSSNCRLTNTSIKNYNPSVKETDYKWVSLYGVNNRVDHCELTGKDHQGTTLVVWLNEKPNYHQIDHNYFGPRAVLGQNGGESIRIGTSTYSMYDSYTTVNQNIFDQNDGEMEIISIKSGHNKIDNNLFYECAGTITFRHGNNSEVGHNYIIGNDKANVGGIRVIGENQKVISNYLQGIPGKTLRAAISVMNAYEKPELNEYWQVKNATIQGNIIIQSREAFVLGSGMDAKRTLAPDGLNITGNYVIDPGTLMVVQDEPRNLKIENNQVKGASLINGFVTMKNDLIESDGIWQKKDELIKPFWLNVPVGPQWITTKRNFVIK